MIDQVLNRESFSECDYQLKSFSYDIRLDFILAFHVPQPCDTKNHILCISLEGSIMIAKSREPIVYATETHQAICETSVRPTKCSTRRSESTNLAEQSKQICDRYADHTTRTQLHCRLECMHKSMLLLPHSRTWLFLLESPHVSCLRDKE